MSVVNSARPIAVSSILKTADVRTNGETKQHRHSRTGCYTCWLRKEKRLPLILGDTKTGDQRSDVQPLGEPYVPVLQHPPPSCTALQSNSGESGWTENPHHGPNESLSEETLNPLQFGLSIDTRQVNIELKSNEQRLLDSLIRCVLPVKFPVLEYNFDDLTRSVLVLPTMLSKFNPWCFHCCLIITAQRLKGDAKAVSEEVRRNIMRRCYATLCSLCKSLKLRNNDHEILEATTALILLQYIIGIPWHQHFGAVHRISKVKLPQMVLDHTKSLAPTPFNVALTAWIDILGASMKGVNPAFAHLYRKKYLSQHDSSLGLREMMGCDDRVMFMISGIARLESLKKGGIDEHILCQHITQIECEINAMEMGETAPECSFNSDGSLSSEQLSWRMTMAFRIAARIYLCTLLPGLYSIRHTAADLLESLVGVLQTIPLDPSDCDRSMVWTYLIGGSVSLPGSSFRIFFEGRAAQLGDQADCGSFGRTAFLLRQTWLHTDDLGASSTHLHWRYLMEVYGWDFQIV